MERRTINQVCIYYIKLNDMRSSNVEIEECALFSFSGDAIRKYMEESHEPWRDGRWNKTYKKDSKLEWYNPPFGGRVTSKWIDEKDLPMFKDDRQDIWV